jgi:signal transduction histidine kinase
MVLKRMVQKLLVMLVASMVFVLLTSSCQQVSSKLHLGQPVIVSADFQTQSLNDRVLVSTKLTEKDLTRKDLKTWISRNAIKVSQKKEAILVGSYRKYPEAWFYAQIINNSSEKQLVVDEFNRIRCDGFEVFTVKDGNVKKWGNIDRLTPFSKYPIPFLTYAIPITINPKDTLDLLIRIKRKYGRLEVNLGVSAYETYMGEQIYQFLSKVLQVIIFILCSVLMFILGSIFGHKAMIYLSYYLISLLMVHISSWGFVSALMRFEGIGLSANNLDTFIPFLSCFFLQPFLMEWMKIVPKNEKVFKGISYFLMGINLFGAACFLVPASIFPQVDAYFFLPQLMLICSMLTILWAFYCSFVALYKAKIYYMLIGFGVAYLPFLLPQLNGAFVKSMLLFQAYHPTFVFAALGLSFISIYLLREQLVTRKKSEENLTQLRETLENIRKNEVETIGRNLHDNVGNMLASVLGHLNLKSQNPEVVKNLVAESMHEVRFLSHNLVKQDNQPIADKFEMLVSRFNDFSTIRLYFSDFTGGKINQMELSRQENLYMMVQEILTNIIKHSKATEAHIQVSGNGESLQVTIEDDGIGIQPESHQKGIGLKNIYKRAELSAFKITLDSNPTGTNYIIEIHENNNNYHR